MKETITVHGESHLKERIFFVSDTHFTYHTISAGERKKRALFLDFLEHISGARRLYLVGDTFDFWFEYRSVIPRYYGDVLHGLYALRRSGTEIYITGGNHDHWFGSYLPDTLGVTILPPRSTHRLQGKTVVVTHGDTLLSGDYAYKILKTLIRSRPVIELSRLVHPDILYPFARWFSQSSKRLNERKTERYARIMCRRAPDDFFRWNNDIFIMGHIHYPLIERYGDRTFVILGDWLSHFSYLKLEGGEPELEYYKPDEKTLIEKR